MTYRRFAILIGVGVALWVWPGVVVAQFEPVYPVTAFRLLDWKGEVYLKARYEAEKETRPGLETEQTDLFTEEGVKLSFAGYAYHPNLVDWQVNLDLGVNQQSTSVNDDDRQEDGQLLGYNINVNLFQSKEIHGRVYAQKSDSFVNRSFAKTIRLNNEVYGVEVGREGDIPIKLTLEQRASSEDYDQRKEDEDTFYMALRAEDRRYENWYTEMLFEHEDTDEHVTFVPLVGATSQFDQPDTRDELNVRNRWRFGPEKLPHHLDGQLRMQRRSGFFESEVDYLQQRLQLNHRADFYSFYSASYFQSATDAQEETSMNFEAGIHKQFYKSLGATLRGYGATDDYSNGEETRYGGRIELDYTKETRWGLLTSNMDYEQRFETESFTGNQRFVQDETVTLTGISYSMLLQPSVVAGTVVVTDVTNTMIYSEGLDYELRVTGAFTEIRRIAGGLIGDGDTVLVDYIATASRDATFTTDILEFRARYQLKDWPIGLYAEYRHRNETLDSGIDPGNLEKRRMWLVGIDWKWEAWMLMLEHEDWQLELGPSYDTNRMRLTYTQRFGAWGINAGAEYEMLQYKNGGEFGLLDGEDYLESYGGYMDATTQLNQTTLIRLENLYRATRGRDETTLIRVGASLNWNLAQTSVSIGAYHEIWEQEANDGTREMLQIQVTRRF